MISPALPSAWLGYKFDFTGEGELLVKVCAWCPDKAQAEQEAARLKCRVTHAICPRHFAERMAEITRERAGFAC